MTEPDPQQTFNGLIDKYAAALAGLTDAPTAEQPLDFVDRVRVARDLSYACHLLHLARNASVVSDQFADADKWLRYAIGSRDQDGRRLALALADGHLRRAVDLCDGMTDAIRSVALVA
ncbi:hypothetical protein [Streptomyces benahoarensis]|uniref:Uncharacterized protein n=1 Tax=Streptomyces benahoarensis TaxID=2595054 RepID=A0A553ZL51_9ACTN|nr:hypothetical protein [Streptomyces benahoarensis]TSB17684.1 hypothetical protein FNJ62_26810 [Streptomyces benahoarensis]TSB42147.1 hypothetical protein FNZ23_11365 [Streptomyces benahoarensis]